MENVTKDSGELTGHVDQKPGVAKNSQAKETKATGSNLLQATIQKMLDKSKSTKSSKASSISSSDTDEERQEIPGGTKSLNVNRSGAIPKPRFQKGMNGCHYHNLQHKKFQRMQKNLFKDFGHNSNSTVNEKLHLKNSNLEASLTEKYGKCQEVIGKGAFGIVRVAHKVEPKMHGEKLFAVKEFKRRNNEPLKKYIKRLTSEFCISSSLQHINVIDTLDLLQDTQGNYCEVMEFCTGGDLYSLIISTDGLEQEEADCFFGQLINGVKYLHDNGVAHRDLKPENILLTSTGCLKITDFGNSECFRMAWETQAHLTRGVCGSEPYIAPEEFTDDWFDPRLVDVWACGIIYMSMMTGRQLWRVAKAQEDSNFKAYLEARAHGEVLEPFSGLSNSRRRMIGKIIEPDPKQRITAEKITKDPWFLRINICHRSSNNAAVTTCSIANNAAGRHATTMNNAALANA